MKRSSLAILGILALTITGVGGYWLFQFYQYRQNYEDRRQKLDGFSEFTVFPITDSVRTRIEEVEGNWWLRQTIQDEYRTALELAGYPATINGLVQSWSDPMPPFSLFDHERNKLWITRSSLLMLTGPDSSPYYKGDGELVLLKDRMAVVMSESEDGMVTKIYSIANKKSNKADMATPRKPSD
jgi:hypothetical protein